MSHVKLQPEVLDVIQRSTISGTTLTLPAGRLDFYSKVKKALEAAGGKWNRSAQGFVFPNDPTEALGLAVSSGLVEDKKKTRQAFYTPDEIALEVVQRAAVYGMHVLEPSAGDGALVSYCRQFGAESVSAFEICADCEPCLKQAGATSILIGDFLEVRPWKGFNVIVMNPPFTKGAYWKHIQHALKFLFDAPSRRQLFAIVPDKECPKLDAMGAVTLRRFNAGAFKESGTNAATKLITILP